jgi:hypothetical protein
MKPSDFKRGEILLVGLSAGRTLLVAEVTKILKRGINVRAVGTIHTEALGCVAYPPAGSVALREPGALRGLKFTDKENRLRVVGIQDSRIKKTAKKKTPAE